MASPRILVVDDEADLRELLEITLLKMGLDVDSADSLAAARSYLEKTAYALALTDMRLPDGLGLELVDEISSRFKHTPVAVITAFGSADNAVAALKAGAFDYLTKPIGLEQLRSTVLSALQSSRRHAGQTADQRTPGQSSLLIGDSAAMLALRGQIARLARSMAPVAISGESGSGKELAAREMHAQSARADQPFVAVNCGAIPEALMEAEFFGYRKGAFTGAISDREGFFQAAHGGTLMLDEVADLPLAMQVKLLRVIQERRVRRLGTNEEELLDVRLISATHKNLADCVKAGQFRQDLFYRLNVIELHLPPLRERLDDVPQLATAILARLAASGVLAVLRPAALAQLQTYRFPGNVRELENILERALAFSSHGVIEMHDLAIKPAHEAADDLPDVLNPSANTSSNASAIVPGMATADSHTIQAGVASALVAPPAPRNELPASLPEHLDGVERELILRALAKTRFNRTQAASLLGISFRQLRYRMQRLAIDELD